MANFALQLLIWNTGRTSCHCSGKKFSGPAANACSSLQLLGPEEKILRAGNPLGERWRGAPQNKKLKELEGGRKGKREEGTGVLTNWSEWGIVVH